MSILGAKTSILKLGGKELILTLGKELVGGCGGLLGGGLIEANAERVK